MVKTQSRKKVLAKKAITPKDVKKAATKKKATATNAKKDSKKEYVLNPNTGKMIQVDGPTYKKVFGKDSSKPRTGVEKDESVPSILIDEILERKLATNEELEDLLKRTTQPAKRRALQAQIKNKTNPRGAATRGWAASAPQRGNPRRVLKAACGDAAFLMPEKLKFPIMSKCGSGADQSKCSCTIDCRGVQAAYNRARQHGYTNIAAAARNLLETKCARAAASLAHEA